MPFSYLKKIKNYYRFAKHNHLKYNHRAPYIQFIEMIVVFFVTGISPGYYLQSGMGKRSLSYRLGFLNQKRYIKKVYKLNNRLYHKVSMNKMIEKSMFTTYGLPTPKLIGFYNPLRGRDVEGNPLTSAEEFKELLTKTDMGRLCLKPTSSFGGKGVRIVDVIKDSKDIALFDKYQKKIFSFEAFWNEYLNSIHMNETEGLVIEECLDQHEEFAKYNETSVNTVRVMVYLNRSDDMVFGAFLRVGRLGAVVDNGESGGIIVKIDHGTGKMGYGCFSKLTSDRFLKHPDTDAPFVGEVLPFWEDIKAFSVDVVKLFPGIQYAGLDIAMSKNGPVVIEMNVQPDYVDFALINKPSKIEFKD